METDPARPGSSLAAASDLFLFLPLESSAPIYRHVYILEIEDGKGKLELLHGITSPCNILHSFNGLILLRMDAKSCLVVMNPLTRMQIFLPLGTMPSWKFSSSFDYLYSESYALTQVPSAGDHKLVHLFRNLLGYIQCETLNLSSRSWESVIDWPAFRLHDEDQMMMVLRPVEAIGALHWLQLSSDHTMVSSRIEDNKFFETSLPTIKKDQWFVRLLEMEVHLCCAVAHKREESMEIWMLNGICGTGWTKQHNIESDQLGNCTCFLSGTKELLFIDYINDDVEVMAYDLKLKQKRIVNIQGGHETLKINGFATDISLAMNTYLPYNDSLAMWKS